MKTLLLCFVVILLCASAGFTTINVPSDGSDGAFNPTASVEVDLSQAVTGTWDQAGNGNGVYDADKWAAVFKYSSVNIPEGVTVTFKNHPSRAPVVWLVQGNVTIAGTVKLDGQDYVTPDPAGIVRKLPEPGPGGFRGGATPVAAQNSGGPGLGPGGGTYEGGGSYGSAGQYSSGPIYGNVGVLPLLGGSGGAAATLARPYSGGGGGGAILIAARDTVTLTGTVRANGGAGFTNYPQSGWGSGGGIRIVADVVVGAGGLSAVGPYTVGIGRIRVEANEGDWGLVSNPAYTCDLPGTDPLIWLPADKPRVKMVSLAGVSIPADPRGGVTFPTMDAYFANPGGTKTLVIQAEHVPLTWKVRARVAPINGTSTTVDATNVSGDETLSTWQANLTLGQFYTAIQVRASAN